MAPGLAANQSVATTILASNWLFGLFVVIPLVTIPIAWRIVRAETRGAARRAGGIAKPRFFAPSGTARHSGR
jgi:hypothetical protein